MIFTLNFRIHLDDLMDNENNKNESITISQLEKSIGNEGVNGSISYIIQSCQVTSLRLSEILIDFTHSLESQKSTNLTYSRLIRNKIRPEISCLRSVIEKVVTSDLKSEINLSFIHPLLAAKCVQLVKDNLMPNEIHCLTNVMRDLQSHLNYIDDSSSDEEETENTRHIIDKEEQKYITIHFCCVVKCVGNVLRLSSDNDNNYDNLRLDDINDCTCRWNSNNIDQNSINNNVSNIGKTQITSTAKYQKAHSFFHYVLYNESDKKPKEKNDIAKVLQYDDDDNENQSKVEAMDLTKDGHQSDDDDDSFATAASSVNSGMETPEEQVPVYING